MADRHRFRADWHDYNNGIYFVTICSHNKACIFGKIIENIFYPTPLGEIITDHIKSIPEFYDDVEIWNYVVMPNHVHIVLSVGTRFIASTGSEPFSTIESTFSANSVGCLKPPRHDEPTRDNHHNARLAVIIGAFKAGVTRAAKAKGIGSTGYSLNVRSDTENLRLVPDGRTRRIASLQYWQSRYHEHIIRTQQSLDSIMNYIDNNIENWNKDCFYQ